MRMCWDLLPLATKCVRGKSSSSAVLSFTVKALAAQVTALLQAVVAYECRQTSPRTSLES